MTQIICSKCNSEWTGIICPISGIPMIRAPYMLGLSLAEVHPLFRTKRKYLITDELIFKFNKAPSTEEKRLYFLAVLNSTELVDFECPAIPSLFTIEKNFLPSIQITYWLDYARYQVPRDIVFPRFKVSLQTKEMDTIQYWLDAIEAIRIEYLRKEVDRERSAKARQDLDKKFKDLKNAWMKDRAVDLSTAKWVLEYTKLNQHPRADTFYKILTTTLEGAYSLNSDDLEELKDLLLEEFDQQHPLYAPFFGQFNQLVNAQKKGFSIVGGYEEEEIIEIAKKAEHDLVESGGNAQGGRPQRKNFMKGKEGDREWMRADARWQLAQMNKKEEKKGEENASSI